MTDSLENRVFALVAQESAVRLDKLSPASTLSHDLGLDGDDAVEFFEKFAKEFPVDLKPLGEDWHCYFAPEGVSFGAGLLVVVPGSIVAIGLIELFPQLPDWLGYVIGLLLWMIALCCWGSWRSKGRDPQITIQDLVDFVRGGTWTKRVPVHIKERIAAHLPYEQSVPRWFTW